MPQGKLLNFRLYTVLINIILRSLSSCQFSTCGSQVVTISSDDRFRLYKTGSITGLAIQPVAQVSFCI